MESSNKNNRDTYIVDFITDTLENTVFASRSRKIIFFVVFFLQFLAAPLMFAVWNHYYPDTYNGLTKKMADEDVPRLYIGLIKYILLLVLLIKSPAERTWNRGCAKYIVLFGAIFGWIIADLLFENSRDNDEKLELARKSFEEGKEPPIYGQVIFASYKQWKFLPSAKDPNRGLYTEIADTLSPATNGYMVIVQLNDTVYTYPGLNDLYHNFNYYTYDGEHSLNIPVKDFDILHCLQFTYDFPKYLNKIPNLPSVGKYVKIKYDLPTNLIEMDINPTTGIVACFDSIPKENYGKIKN